MKDYICRCGGKIREQKIEIEGIITKALKCQKCGEVSFTKEQVKKLTLLRDQRKKIKSRRKIIQVGNSLAITLPKGIEFLDFRKGTYVSLDLLGASSLKISKLK